MALDTNVVLSALVWRGTPYRLLQLVHEQSESIRLFSSETSLRELAEVLNRPRFAKPLISIGHSPSEVLADYAMAVDIVVPTRVPKAARDPDDDHVLACALAAQADAVVSGDADLIALQRYEKIQILTATQAIGIVERKT